MPLYEYRCTSCGQQLEVMQRLADVPLTQCASCGGVLVKVISAPALQFRGSGWYVTDYGRSGSTGNGSKASTGEPSAPKDAAKPSSTPPADVKK